MNIDPEYSHIVQVSELGDRPLEIDLTANEQERAALTQRLKISSLEQFEAHVSLVLLKSGDVDVVASFKADVIQPCTVTLDPVTSNLSAEFKLTYSPFIEEDEGDEEDEEDDDEVFEDLNNRRDPPEPLVDQKIDVGEALIEQLALEINPFPRVQGAVFEGYVSGSKSEKESGFKKKNPFAALSQLQTKPLNKKNKD